MSQYNKPSVGLEKQQGNTRLFTTSFTSLLIAQLFSLLGSAVLRFALPLHILNISHSVMLYATVSACAWLPYIFITPIGGIISDRVHKSVLMGTLDIFLAFSCCIYFIASSHVNMVSSTLILMMILYAIQSMYQPAVQASIPAMVATRQVSQATALTTQISTLTSIIGPAFGGIILGFTTIETLCITSCVGFVISATLIIAFVRVPKAHSLVSGNPWQIVVHDTQEALHFLAAKPLIWKTILISMLINLLTSAFIMVGSTFIITQVWHNSNQVVGIAEALISLGGLLGGLLVYKMPERFSFRFEPKIITITSFGLSFVLFSVGFQLSNIARMTLFIVGLCWVMIGASVFSILAISYIQIHTPEEHTGKVIALAMSAATCALPIGQFIYGFAFNSVSPSLLVCIVIFGMAALDILIALTFHKYADEVTA